MAEPRNEGPAGARATVWLALIAVLDVLFLLSLAPWALFVLTSLLFMDAPGPFPPSFYVSRAVLWSYPLGVVAAVVASGIAYRRRRPRLAALLSLLPSAYGLAFLALSTAGHVRQAAERERETTAGEVYRCSGERVLKVNDDGSVWQLEGKVARRDSLVGYLTRDRRTFMYGGVEADLSACRSAAGKAFLDAFPAMSHLFACADGSRLRLEADPPGVIVFLVDDELRERVYFGRVSDKARLTFVYNENYVPGPHRDDAARRAHTLTCRDAQGRTLLDLYAPGKSERIEKR